MRALSIRQPWAWLIVRPDLANALQRARAYGAGQMKDIENRTWRTKLRGQFLVHAAAGMTTAEYRTVQSYLTYPERRPLGIELPPQRELQRGGIIGVVDLVDCVEASESPWYMGAVGFKLANARPLPFIPFKGALQFFNVPDSILEGVDTL